MGLCKKDIKVRAGRNISQNKVNFVQKKGKEFSRKRMIPNYGVESRIYKKF